MTETAQPVVARPTESFLSIWSRRALILPATPFKGSVWLFSMNVHVERLELARSGPLALLTDDWIARSRAAEVYST